MLLPLFQNDRNWKGLNLKTPDTNLTPTEFPNLQDIDFFQRYIQKRRGATRFNKSVLRKSSLYFQGTSTAPRVQLAHRSAYNFGTQFTIEFGLRFIDLSYNILGYATPPTGTMYLFTKGPDAANSTMSFIFNRTVDGRLVFGVNLGGTVVEVWSTHQEAGSGAATNFQFDPLRDYFISVTRVRNSANSTTLNLYVDGTLLASTTNTTAGIGDQAVSTNTSSIVVATTNALEGPAKLRMGELRLFNDLRTTTEISRNAGRELLDQDLDANCVGYWPFSDGSSFRANDRSATDNDGTLQPNPPEWAASLLLGVQGDWALRFDGLDDFFQVDPGPDALSALASSTIWTVQLKAALHSTNTGQYLAMYGRETTPAGDAEAQAFSLYVTNDGSAVPRVVAELGGYSGSTTLTSLITSALNVTSGQTYNLSLTRYSNTASLSIQTAGAGNLWYRQTIAFTLTPPNVPPSVPFFLSGRTCTTQTNPLFGPIAGFAQYTADELRVWAKSIYGEEKLDVEIPNPDKEPALRLYIRFREGTGTQAADASLSGLVGELRPTNTGPAWQTGIVDPELGPAALGGWYYEKVQGAVRPGAFPGQYVILAAGVDIWGAMRDGEFTSFKTGLTQGLRWSFDIHDDLLLMGNGVDTNQKFDGTRVENLGIEPPTTTMTAGSAGSSGTFTASFTGGTSGLTVFAADRTETLGFWNSATLSVSSRAQVTVAFYSPATASLRRTDTQTPLNTPYGTVGTTLTAQLWQGYVGQSGIGGVTPSSLDFVLWVNNLSPDQIPLTLRNETGYLEGLYIQVPPALNQAGITANQFRRISLHRRPISIPSDPNANYIRVTLHTGLTTVGGVAPRAGTVLWITSTPAVFAIATNTPFSPAVVGAETYSLPTAATGFGGTTGATYNYLATFYNPRTDTESDPGPESSSVRVTNNVVRVFNLPVSTDPQVTARRIYRTLADGSLTWFFVGQVNDNQTTTFMDRSSDDTISSNAFIPEGDTFTHGVPPAASFVKVFKSRAFYAGVLSAPNRIYFSEVDQPEYVPAENFRSADTGDGDVITGLGLMADHLLVFKRSSIWEVIGTDDNLTLRLVKIDSGIGCFAHQTIVPIENRIFFASDRGVFAYNGQADGLEYLSEPIEPLFRALNGQQLKHAVAVHRRLFNSYLLSIPLSGFSENNLSLNFNYVDGVWTRWSSVVSTYVRARNPAGDDLVYLADYQGFVRSLDSTSFNDYKPGASGLTGTVSSTGVTGAYDALVSGTLDTLGSGVKGLPIYFDRAGTTVGTGTVAWNTAGGITLATALAAQIIPGDTYRLAPILGECRTAWMDFGDPERPKRFHFLHTDHFPQGSTMTLNVAVGFNRFATTTKTIGINMFTGTIRTPIQGRGYQMQLFFWNYNPDENFQVANFSAEGLRRALK